MSEEVSFEKMEVQSKQKINRHVLSYILLMALDLLCVSRKEISQI